MKASIYVRVSTVEQAKEGFSLAAQEERCLQYIQSQGWTYVGTYKDDGYSAKDLNRPGIQRLIQDVKEKKFDCVVVYRLDRLVRSITDLHHLLDLFEKHHVAFKSATETYDTTSAIGRLFISIVGAMAQWERENLSERIRMGMEQRFLEKKRHQGRAAYGYDLVDGKLVINPEEAKVVRRIHELYKTNGITRIAHILNQEGIRTKNGSRWSDPQIRYILTNPIYIGQIRYHPKKEDKSKYHIVEGEHEPILTKEQFENTQKLLEIRRGAVVPPKAMTSDYPFSGVLYCSRCGHPFTGRFHYSNRYKLAKRYAYRCTGRFSYGVCDAPEISELKLEREFFKYLKVVAKDIQKPEDPKDEEGPDPRKRIKEIEAELERIKNRRRKWQEAFANEAITLEELIERTQEDRKREERLKEELSSISLTPEKPQITNEEFIKAIEDISTVWEKATRPERKELIQSIFRRIYVTKDGNEPDAPIVFTDYELL